MTEYPKRLIEVDLPIKRISAHARREKSIRHGHISTLHIWWARRPLAACRAVILASLWPDPADDQCPPRFLEEARKTLRETRGTSVNVPSGQITFDHQYAQPKDVRAGLLDFIAEFANWDNSTNPDYLKFARHLVQVAHESLGGEPGTRPLVVDPFAGGGSIPLEALRVGADAFASDLNPVAVLLNKVVLEYIPKYGQRLADEVRRWGAWIQEQAKQELAEFYPKDPDGAIPIAYLWARTIRCEGPGCGVEVPMIRSLWLSRRGSRLVALKLVPNSAAKRVDFEIVPDAKVRDVREGTVKRGSASCPCCGYTTPVPRVREQLKARRGGADDARLFCVVTLPRDADQRTYRTATSRDTDAFANARMRLAKLARERGPHTLSWVPDEVIPPTEIRRVSVPIYGMTCWGNLFSARQALAISTLVRLLACAAEKLRTGDSSLTSVVVTVMGLAISRFADISNALCMWETSKTQVRHMFTRQAIGMLWDYAEPNIFADAAGNFSVTLGTMIAVLEREALGLEAGHVEQASATQQALPEDSAQAIVTDPPYYDAVPYAHLSDFFYVWLRRVLHSVHPELFRETETPKIEEVVVDRPHELSQSSKGIAFYERELTKSFAESRRVLRPDGVGTIVFASKTTASWEAILQALVDAGWVITGSWPIDTEMENRIAARGQARLASSVHLVCRPRENAGGSFRTDDTGEWRDVLQVLPRRIHEWLPRLAEEGIVGADAIFACLGPALEIFSRYSRVEKANGNEVSLREYLEHVWAAVSKEALSVIFDKADPTGLEDDARLTLIWFWVLKAVANGEPVETSPHIDEGHDGEDDELDIPAKNGKQGFAMEFDASRKLAQGLGVDLLQLGRPGGILKISGNISMLFRVSQREPYLIGRQLALFGDESKPRKRERRPKDPSLEMKSVPMRQEHLFAEEPPPELDLEQPMIPGLIFPQDDRTNLQRLVDSGQTMLDRLHQAMLLFGRDQLGLLRPLLIETGMATNNRFWLLAQSLSALYPPGTDEKRWVDGVLARKKGLGFS